MKSDPVVSRRLEELSAKADAVSQQKKFDFTNDETGEPYFKIPSGPFNEWATNVLNLLARAFGESSVHYEGFANHYRRFSGWESQFEDCRAIFRAAREDWEGGYLFNLRSLVKAEVLSDSLDQAKELLAARYKDPACILARVALEVTLKDLCLRHGIPPEKLDRMNVDLCKAGVYNMAKQKQVTAWADLGNKGAHGEWSEYTEADIRAMVDGVEGFIGMFL